MTAADHRPERVDAVEDADAVGSPQALGTVITTAVMTAAVVPFVQAIAKKAAEDSYDAVRSLLRRMFRDARTKNGGAANGATSLLIIENDDPAVQTMLYARPDMSDAAIRALSELDLDDATGKSRRGKPKKVRIFWNETSGQWQIDRK
jgi:hypothetical protein